MLGIALVLYIFIILWELKLRIILKLLSILIICSASAIILFSSLDDKSYSRFDMKAILYELSWRGETLFRFIESTEAHRLSPLIGAGLGQFEKDSEYDAMARVGSGILGGDLVVAYGLGGIGGILILTVLWIAIWKMNYRSRFIKRELYQANILFIILLTSRSLFMPVLMIFILVSNIITFINIAFLVLISDMVRNQRSQEIHNTPPS
jgi:hypothetical protein